MSEVSIPRCSNSEIAARYSSRRRRSSAAGDSPICGSDVAALTDVYVGNGGYGGVHFAMEHGVSLVVAGTTEDKVGVTARVARSGAGINLKSNRPSAV